MNPDIIRDLQNSLQAQSASGRPVHCLLFMTTYPMNVDINNVVLELLNHTYTVSNQNHRIQWSAVNYGVFMTNNRCAHKIKLEILSTHVIPALKVKFSATVDDVNYILCCPKVGVQPTPRPQQQQQQQPFGNLWGQPRTNIQF